MDARAPSFSQQYPRYSIKNIFLTVTVTVTVNSKNIYSKVNNDNAQNINIQYRYSAIHVYSGGLKEIT
jgi:hypothetical protein